MPDTPPTVCFAVNGVLFVGTPISHPAPAAVHDDLLAGLIWPADALVLVDVRLAASDAPVAACVVLQAHEQCSPRFLLTLPGGGEIA